MPSNKVIFHIIYIHGFRGDHTTFQSFPSDLHRALLPLIPTHVELRSILYPTYKSKRPIAAATEKFLGWLETLPPGPVILCGHSMGGLLAAEAATSSAHPASKRVVALLGCDVPFLGMHPHVVISGIASLLPQKSGRKGGPDGDAAAHGAAGLKTEKEMNDAMHVAVLSEDPSRTPSPSPSASSASLPQPFLPAPVASSPSTLAPPPPLLQQPRAAGQKTPTDHRAPSPSRASAVVTRVLDFIHSHSDDPLVNFIARHRSEPLAAATRWVVETFEFGICMFDPKGLKERYGALEKWSGDWVVFWTKTVPRGRDGEQGRGVEVEKGGDEEQGLTQEEATASLGRFLEVDSVTTDAISRSQSLTCTVATTSSPEHVTLASASGPPTKFEHSHLEKKGKADEKLEDKMPKFSAKADKKLRETELMALLKQRNKPSPHHFVIRPFRTQSGTAQRWEQVLIRGAKDEVEAHCGLFLKDLNLEYEMFLERVADVVKGWVEKSSDVRA